MTPGTRFGPYEIRREVGRGAMGVVLEAWDPAIQRVVALKVLQVDASAETRADELRARFRREGEVAGALVHPNIAAVYDFQDGLREADGRRGPPFIVMEFVAGGDLKARLAGKARFALPQVALVMRQLLGALQHAHGRGLVHRDVKPANVMLRENGHVKLTDFGIARIADSDLTQTGEVMGTIAYMSPEQLTGQAVDARADLYACGVILYELLTGEPPFAGSATTVMQKILNQEPLPPSKLNPALPPGVDAVLRRALAKRPDDRFPDAAAFERAIVDTLCHADDQATMARPAVEAAPAPARATAPEPAPSPARARRVTPARAMLALVTAVVLGLVSVNAWYSWGPGRKAASTAATSLHSAEEIERMAWDRAQALDTPAAYRAYIAAYPQGAYVRLAQVHLAGFAPARP